MSEIPVADATNSNDGELLEQTEFPPDEYPELPQVTVDLGREA
jgi:hypothetical protein